MDKIAVGIVTYNRPTEFEIVAKAAATHFDVPIFAYNDGSPQVDEYKKLKADLAGTVELCNAPENVSVGYAKNRLLETMLESGADWLFLLEDDVIPQSPEAITRYVEGCRRSGWHHLMFAHHGERNVGLPLSSDRNWGIEFYLHCVGAWTIYTRECIETVGLIDETFVNAWEHVEHTSRLAKAGLTAPFWNFADIAGSATLLSEMDINTVPTACSSHPDYAPNVQAGLDYWFAKDPDCPLKPKESR